MLYSRSHLPSGIRVVSERMPEVRSASVGFWVGLGSRDEEPDAEGASHFLEHLLFKGTDHHSATEIAETFDAVGGEANAFCTKEYTCFYARVLDDDLPMALDILCDMLRNANLQDTDVESERRVVLEEISMKDDAPEDLVHDILMEVVFGDHPLAREVMGTAGSVSTIPASRIRSFYTSHYRPANVVVAAAGNVDHEEILERIDGAFDRDELPPHQRTLKDPVSTGRLRVVPRETEQAHILIGGLGHSRHHPERFAWGVLDNLLGGGGSSRLFQEVRERRGLAYSVYSYRSQFSETGLWGVYAGTSPHQALEVTKIISDELDRLLEGGVTEEEVERAKGYTRGGLVLSLEDSSSRMSRLGRSELMHGEILTIDELIEKFDEVTLDDVRRVAEELLPVPSRVLALIGPFKEDDFKSWDG